ncbi:hypothetical protein CASFOL_016884 [Castilleja foliolosa]|uniref:Uncharacterized protein n=1 Tax=Castilleja foliolosa TaxID=1961234 RepID=A0ABD3DBB1_9LAMI
MITRSKLAEQLREYQIRSKYDWSSFSLFSSTSNLASSRVDVAIFVIWELVILAFFVFSATSLYFRHFSKTSSEKAAKDASPIIYVEISVNKNFSQANQLFLVRSEFLAIHSVHVAPQTSVMLKTIPREPRIC